MDRFHRFGSAGEDYGSRGIQGCSLVVIITKVVAASYILEILVVGGGVEVS